MLYDISFHVCIVKQFICDFTLYKLVLNPVETTEPFDQIPHTCIFSKSWITQKKGLEQPEKQIVLSFGAFSYKYIFIV